MLKEQIAYLKDNPQRLWFKRKLYGWGWTPATWQGWLVVLAYVVLVLVPGFFIDDSSSAQEVLIFFILPIVMLTIILINICYKKGEKPKWQWGDKKKK